ncbi:MAG: ATP-dependent DNA helicase RecQ, partial [Bacteroidales bacterium]
MESNQSKIHRILELYWGYKQFRSLQEEIILHILEGKDALALLPTGGGKSICFQVPALVLEGVCIVVSPLIALMKDQIENLKKRDIAAEAIYSGLSEAETDLYLNQAVFGRLKFLYVSPERCKNEKFIAHLKQMKVCLLAVDEAHCISQWGYDFRPAYLEISSLRDYLPGVPLLALTATATKEVVEDIQKKLHIQPFKLFQKSFQRDNLTYYVIEEEDKFGRLLRIIRKVKGSGIVYVRNRRKTVDVADFLCRNGISAASYHAGLSTSLRNQRQENWKEDRVQVIVATNAFGMGIDKSNVRFVVHVDLPDTLEAYFQEAGRGGRDGKRAFAILLYHPSDKKEVEERFSKTYPELVFIKNVYEALGNYYQIPVGMGEGSVFKIDIKEFCNTYKLPIIETFSAL